jgi:hypothetical protein
MSNRVSNLITLDLVKQLRKIKNVSAKNYSYEARKILADEVNKDININNNNQLMKDFLFIHKYGIELWLKS